MAIVANYQEFKTKKFKLKKEAKAFLSDFKKKNNLGNEKYKVETNFNAGEPQPWEAIILRKI
jgi:hypothetical protein